MLCIAKEKFVELLAARPRQYIVIDSSKAKTGVVFEGSTYFDTTAFYGTAQAELPRHGGQPAPPHQPGPGNGAQQQPDPADLLDQVIDEFLGGSVPPRAESAPQPAEPAEWQRVGSQIAEERLRSQVAGAMSPLSAPQVDDEAEEEEKTNDDQKEKHEQCYEEEQPPPRQGKKKWSDEEDDDDLRLEAAIAQAEYEASQCTTLEVVTKPRATGACWRPKQGCSSSTRATSGQAAREICLAFSAKGWCWWGKQCRHLHVAHDAPPEPGGPSWKMSRKRFKF